MRHLPLRRSAILPGRAFYVIGDSNGISYYIKIAGNISFDNSKKYFRPGA
jgi:hypothetical protein